ncbi:MAG: cytochrome c, partial [Devosia nanyangense]|nr:cytochrome c [Devosia nanyangense]
MFRTASIIAAATISTGAIAQDAEVSVANGERISIIGGCHDCHSAGYSESNGKIDPATALKGNPVGYN